MNDKREQLASTAIDPRVAEQYALLADEAAPAELDRIVLRNATGAARTEGRQYAFMAWLRPAAFVATAGLSLALILDLHETGIVTPQVSIVPEVQRPTAVQPMLAPAADDATGGRSAAETASALRREKSLTAVSSKMAPPESNEYEDGAGTAAQAGEVGQCNERQKSAVAAWWQCVVTLRQAGLHEIADSEVESLQAAYPDFVVPE